MEIKTILKAGIKKHMVSLIGITFLTLLVSISIASTLSFWTSSGNYVHSEIKRAGYGEMTAWVSKMPDSNLLVKEISAISDVERVETQKIVFSDYTANNKESDSEGQLIAYNSEDKRYRFFADNLKEYKTQNPTINSGEVYVSPSMISMFGIKIGDAITFPIARNGNNIILTIKGFYEDPFMGSSMVGMKGFLINSSDYDKITQIVNSTGINALAKNGAMLHIFSKSDSKLTISELNTLINQKTSLLKFSEFVHSETAISGFMLVLQNAFCGLLVAFAIILLFVVLIILGHSISSAIDADYVNMGILKTVGLTAKKLRLIQIAQYTIAILFGIIAGLILSIPISNLIVQATLTTTGILVPAKLPILWCSVVFAGILILLIGFILFKSKKICRIAPMKAIRGDTDNTNLRFSKSSQIKGKFLSLQLALRQLKTGKRRYIGVCIVAILLVFFTSLVGHMSSWLGPDGKGMMDAFNPAEHDIGIQVFGSLSSEEAENVVLKYTKITDSYLLAMPGVSVNGIDYTANVISEPERFHIQEGKTCMKDNEIVITEFVAANFGVSIGDKLTVRGDMGSAEYTVSGIYTCANDMGDNIGMSRDGYYKIGQDNPQLWCHHYFLADTSKKSAISESLENAYGGDIHVHYNTWPGLFGIISAMHLLMMFMYGMVFIFILVVTGMTASKLLASEQKDIGIYKALGYTSQKLRRFFALRFGIVSLIGSLIGCVLSSFLTDPIVSAVMKLAGISNFRSSLTIENTLLPVMTVILLFFAFAYLTSGKIKRTDLTVLITE